jgi:hypothetical protein
MQMLRICPPSPVASAGAAFAALSFFSLRLVLFVLIPFVESVGNVVGKLDFGCFVVCGGCF